MSVTKKEETKTIYPSLNGLRAISILFVIFGHLEYQYHIFRDSFPLALKPFWLFITKAQIGVNVFFVISGFLITSLLIEEEKKTQEVFLKNFYIRRTLRIFPAYYFYLLVLLALHISGIIYISKPSWCTAVTYTKYFNWSLDWFTGHAWSLSVEEHFYLLFPLLFTLGNKVRKRVALLLVLLVPVIKIYTYYHRVSWINDLTIFKRIDALAIGCLIAFYREEILQRLNKYFTVLFYASFLGIFLVDFLPGISAQYNLHLDFIFIPFGTRYGTIANICIGIILLYSVFGHQGLWFRLLNTKLFNYTGLLSYSIYLWQQLFISGLPYRITSFPQNILFLLICAVCSYYCIEKPFLKLKDRFSSKK